MKKFSGPLLTILFLFLPAISLAATTTEIPRFTKNDKILILAAHPDDETLGCGGIIQKALKAGAKVKLVLFTNGDNNEPAFIIYEKRLTFRKGEFIHMGEVRRKETISAMNYLGLSAGDVIFLGYPDFGTMQIFTSYWATTKPFKSFFTRTSKVPYPECLSQGAPYVGESILSDLKKVLHDFRPTKIFLSHPADTNGDHKAQYLFLRVALWDMKKEAATIETFPYIIHVYGWPEPRGYHPELGLEAPKKVEGVAWRVLPLTAEEIEKKHTAISYYKSQIEYNPSYLFTFDRKNELFGDYPIIELKRLAPSPGKIEWVGGNTPGSMSYGSDNLNFYIKFNLKNLYDKDAGLSAYVFGYSGKTAFASMPKLRVIIGTFGLRIKDKKNVIVVPGGDLSYEGNSVIVKVPFGAIGNPDYIVTSSRGLSLSYNSAAWRIIKLIR